MTTASAAEAFARVHNTAWVRILMVIALALAGVLLLSDLRSIPGQLHTYLSSLPLAMAGIAYAILQVRRRPARGTLLKRLLLAATFLIWAVDQLLPSGRLATFVGDVVIAAYVLDLYWLFREQVAAVTSPSDRDYRSI